MACRHRRAARRPPRAHRANPTRFDTGAYRKAITSGHPDRRPLFTAIHGSAVTWADGTREHVDTIILATGYRPDVAYLKPLGALDHRGHPRQSRGLSTTHPGLGYIGLEWQRSAASASLHGVGRDARFLARHLLREARHLNRERPD